MSTITETLQNAGFEPSTAEIYVILLQNGELDVPKISEKTAFSRASIYDSLNQLLAAGYIEYRKEGRNAYYKPAHPNKLFGLVEQKKRESELLRQELNSTIQSLTGMYNLSLNKPGIRFFEGAEGFREALFDTLTSTETIYTIVDLEAVLKYVEEINQEYVAKRREKGINKRILVTNTPGNRAYLAKQGKNLTDAKLLPAEIPSFENGMQIYSGKVSHFTLREDNIVAIIIEDKDVYYMQKKIFEYLWAVSVDFNKTN
jgi:sugar-specific transcriptional regulator TrmB